MTHESDLGGVYTQLCIAKHRQPMQDDDRGDECCQGQTVRPAGPLLVLTPAKRACRTGWNYCTYVVYIWNISAGRKQWDEPINWKDTGAFTDGSCITNEESGSQSIGAGVYRPQSNNTTTANYKGSSINKSINRSKLAGIAAALINEHTLIATDRWCTMANKK